MLDGLNELPQGTRLVLYSVAVLAPTLAAALWPAVGRVHQGWRNGVLAVAAGLMLGAAFFHMLPEAVHHGGPRTSYAVVLGFVLLLLLERFVLVHACDVGPPDPDHDPDCPAHPPPPATLGLTAFVGFSLHTVADGVALGAAMATSEIGLAVLLAIVLHKIPLSFSLAAFLRMEGRAPARILGMVTVLALMVPVGAGAYLGLLPRLDAGQAATVTPYALAFGAGTFLHVAITDLLPELHRRHARALPSLTWAGVGLLAMYLLTRVLPHAH